MPGWDDSYFKAIGLEDLVAEGYARIGQDVRDIGGYVGSMPAAVAEQVAPP